MKLATAIRTALLFSVGVASAAEEGVSIQSIMDGMDTSNEDTTVETQSTDDAVSSTSSAETSASEAEATSASVSSAGGSFNRIATWFVCTQLDPTCNIDDETSAETIWVTKDHNTLVYTDSPGKRVGFIDISDASAPDAMGFVDLPGEPTTVRIHGDYGKYSR